MQTQFSKIKTGGGRHFLNNIFQDYEVDGNEGPNSARGNQDNSLSTSMRAGGAAVQPGLNSATGFMTKNSLAQFKNDIYDFLNVKLGEIHNTYS